jgi:hypothetical protein
MILASSLVPFSTARSAGGKPADGPVARHEWPTGAPRKTNVLCDTPWAGLRTNCPAPATAVAVSHLLDGEAFAEDSFRLTDQCSEPQAGI